MRSRAGWRENHGSKEYFVTTADRAAQLVFVTLLRQWFPGFGIVAEEDALRVPCTLAGRDLWFSVDPLDGTRAFMRRQSHGIGTMTALIDGDEVIAACVGDVMTSEVYAARPDDPAVHRVSEFGIAERLVIETHRTLAEQHLLRSEPRGAQSPWTAALTDGQAPLFRGLEMARGSLGITLARLWKSEVGGVVFGPFPNATPWDIYPVVCMSERLGFVFFALDDDPRIPPRRWRPLVSRDGTPIPGQILALHESRLAEFDAWCGPAVPA